MQTLYRVDLVMFELIRVSLPLDIPWCEHTLQLTHFEYCGVNTYLLLFFLHILVVPPHLMTGSMHSTTVNVGSRLKASCFHDPRKTPF